MGRGAGAAGGGGRRRARAAAGRRRAPARLPAAGGGPRNRGHGRAPVGSKDGCFVKKKFPPWRAASAAQWPVRGRGGGLGGTPFGGAPRDYSGSLLVVLVGPPTSGDPYQWY